MLSVLEPKPRPWQRSNYSLLSRQIDVFGSAAKLAFYLWWDRTFGLTSTSQRQRRAEWLTGTLLNLGPTFIKIGQAMSTRGDLIPLEYVQTLSQLQDRVPQFNALQAVALVEEELGGSIHALFREFDRTPLAAASLGQVHLARLHTGEDVIVKVQRPGLKRLFDLDCQAIERLLKICRWYLPWTRQYELESIYQEFFTILYQEIDYVQEGKNADRFRENFLGYPRIKVPLIYWKYTTSKVLTMEYAPGIKIDDRPTMEAQGINVKEINQIGMCCYLKQLLQDGFFQADPHPGNLAVSQNGSLIFYDFGMMSEVKPLAKSQMIKTFFAVLKKDTDEVVDTLTAMGLIVPVADMTPVRRLIAFILERFTEKPIDIQAFGQLKSEIYEMFQQQPFRLPAQMTFILKALTTLDGIARTLDPDYNLVTGAQPFIKSLTLSSKGRGNAIGELARQAKSLIQARFNQPNSTELLVKRLEERLERGELQIRVRSVETDRTLKRINLAVKSLVYACLTGFSVLTAAILLVGGYKVGAIGLFGLSGLWLLILLRSLLDLTLKEKLDRLVEK